MLRRHMFRFLPALLLVQGLWWPASRAQAAALECNGRIEEPTKIVIDCAPGYATEHDTIDVYLRQPARAGASWREALNYEDALWIYNVGASDRAGLIIDFHRSGNKVIADLYDDQNGDGVLRYGLRGSTLLIDEPVRVPIVKVTADGGWWLPSGKLNFNLDLDVDGPAIATNELYYVSALKTDGKNDYQIHVRDPEGNGKPNYEWRQVYPPLDEADGFYHTLVMANTKDDEPEIDGRLFWPFLGSGAKGFIKEYYIKDHQLSQAPINVDWTNKKIDIIGEFVASRASTHNYFVYSTRRIQERELNATNFESPFAFYSLGGPNPAFPDLTIRVAYWPKKDLVRNTTVEQVDFTWRHNDSAQWDAPNWDYRLGLLGRNEQPGQVDFKEFSLAIAPYDQLPRWVTQSQWDYGTFVARESGEYLTSEHIYEWSTLEGVVNDYSQPVDSPKRGIEETVAVLPDYVRGKYNGDIGKYYQSIRTGLRGEFSPSINARPYLYMSPIDHKLHLLKADHGVWNIDDTSEIRYANLDGDGYLDQWVVSEKADGAAAREKRRLNVGGGFLLYGDEQSVVIRRAAAAASQFEILPPTTPDEWLALKQKLGAAHWDGAADDLLSMLRQFDGSEMQINGASLRDYRLTGKGSFRFVLDVRPGYSVGGDDLFSLRDLQPGSYAVEYDGDFHVIPATPPAPSIQLADLSLQQLQPVALQIQLQNAGVEDLKDATLELQATSPLGRITTVTTETVTLLAQTPTTKTIQWAPPFAGAWTLTPRLRLPDGSVAAETQARMTVVPVSAPSVATLIDMSASTEVVPLLAVVLLCFAALGGIAIWKAFPVESKERM